MNTSRTIEEKAKAYDEALTRAKEWITEREQLICPREIIESIFPELSESESEDERIRITLIHIVKGACDKYGIKYRSGEISEEKLLSYLEKQKEQKPSDLLDTILSKDPHLPKQAVKCEQKPIKGGDIITKDTDRYHRVFMVLGTVDERNYNEKYSRYCESLLLGVDGNVCCDNTDLKGFRITNTEERAQFLHDFNCSVSVSVKQKPNPSNSVGLEQNTAEWSEEDERMRNQLIYDVEYHKKEGLISAKQNKATKSFCNGLEECYDEKIDWLKSLPERFDPQPMQEWSEEDKRAIDDAIEAISAYSRGDIPYILPSELLKDAERLKSLRPSWKPSKEQIEALKNVIRISPPGENNDILVSLFNDFKKLM